MSSPHPVAVEEIMWRYGMLLSLFVIVQKQQRVPQTNNTLGKELFSLVHPNHFPFSAATVCGQHTHIVDLLNWIHSCSIVWKHGIGYRFFVCRYSTLRNKRRVIWNRWGEDMAVLCLFSWQIQTVSKPQDANCIFAVNSFSSLRRSIVSLPICNLETITPTLYNGCKWLVR